MKDKKTVAQILGENLKRIRTEKGVSRKELAEKLGVAQNTIASYENGIKTPLLEKVFLLAEILKVSVVSLTGENDFSDNVPNVEKIFENAKKIVDDKIFEYRLQRAIKIAEGVQCKIEVLKSGEVSVTFPNQISVEGNNKISVNYNLSFAPVIFGSAKDFVLVMESVEKSALAENEVFLEKLRKVIFRPKQVLETTINELRNKA